jgi:glucokinase
MEVLAGDIGGTKTRLAIFKISGSQLESQAENTYKSEEYPSLDEIIAAFLEATQGRCDQACFGIAGPVKEGKSKTTNLPWLVDASHLRSTFGLENVSLLNDSEANAWGIRVLSNTDFFTLNVGAPDASGNAAVIAAGTGLGEAGLYWDGHRHRPFATEGGHADFGPGNDFELELFKFLSRRFGHVSLERILSGPGLVNLYRFLLKYRQRSDPEWLANEMRTGDPAAAISNAALSNRDPTCVEALDLFVHLYGREAGNHALKLMATGGVFIGGGIAPKILDKLKETTFMEAFCAKGRMANLLRDMPVKVILNDRTALYGPAIFVAQEIRHDS